MAAPRNDRLAPPLMFAFRAAHEKRDAKKTLDLRDEAGERVIAARRMTARAAVSDAVLRREVMRDILDLLNTTNFGAAQDVSTTPEARRSILNYGLPDIAWRTIDENGLAEIARELEVSLTEFEPRLARGSIKAVRDFSASPDELKLRFLVRADLRAYPLHVPIEFVAEIDFASGKIVLNRA
jgi:type VI secretion system protein ImpF